MNLFAAAWGGWARFVARRRGPATALLLLATLAVLGAAAMRGPPRTDFTPQALFIDPEACTDGAGRDDCAAARLRESEAIFGRGDDEIVVIAEGLPPDEEGASALRALHAALVSVPEIVEVDSLVDATVLEGGPDGLLEVRTPMDELPLGEAARRVHEEGAGALLASADGEALAVRARVEPGRRRVAELEPAVDHVLEAVRAVPLPPGARLHVTGIPFVRVDVIRRLNAENLRFVPVIAVLFVTTVALLFRRLGLGLVPLVAVAVADAWAMGTLAALGVTFNVLSVLLPTLVVVIGVADGVHVAARYREELARDGDRAAALERAMRAMALACFLTTFTTAAGFGSLVAARTRVLSDFGWQSALALAVTWVAVMATVPVLLAWLPPDRVAAPPARRAVLRPLLAGIDRAVRRHPAATIAATLLLTAAAAVPASRVVPNSSLMELYPPGSEVREAQRVVDEKLGGAIPIAFEVRASEPGAVLEPEALAAMEEVEALLRAEEPVRWTTSPASELRRVARLLRGGEHGLPRSREEAAQELLLIEMAAGNGALDALLGPERRRARVVATLADTGSRSYLALRDSVEDRGRALLARAGLDGELTGNGIVAALGLHRLVEDLLRSTGLVFAIVLLTFLALQRSARLALVAAVPNAVPLVFTLATIALTTGELQTTNIVSFTVAVGLAVDDTIHFLARYGEERARGRSPEDAITAAFSGAGTGIVLTSVLLVVGFGVLATSEVASTRSFGLLSAVTMVAALLGDLFLLPALLHRVEARRAGQGAAGAASPGSR